MMTSRLLKILVLKCSLSSLVPNLQVYVHAYTTWDFDIGDPLLDEMVGEKKGKKKTIRSRKVTMVGSELLIRSVSRYGA